MVNTKEKEMATENTIDAFGENVFTLKKMKSYISGDG